MPAPTYRRRQYLVDRGYQLRFVSHLFLVVLAIAVTSCLVSSGLLWKNLYLPEDTRHTPLLVASLLAVAATLLIELLLAIPLVFFLGIRHSHRVIGPMKRLKQTLEAIGQGDFGQRITLREGDVLQDLATAINKMAEDLQRRFPQPPRP